MSKSHRKQSYSVKSGAERSLKKSERMSVKDALRQGRFEEIEENMDVPVQTRKSDSNLK
jgi:hypothetical protein